MLHLANEPGEDFNSAMRVLKLTKPYLKEILIICFLMLLGSSVAMLLPQMVGIVIDLSSENTRQLEELTEIALILILLFLFSSVLGFATSYWLGKIGAQFSRSLRADLYQKIIYMPPSFFNENKVGDLMSRLTASLSTIQRVVVMQLPKGGQAIVRFNLSLILLFFLHYKMTLIALVVVPAIVGVGFFFGKKFKSIADREQNIVACNGDIFFGNTIYYLYYPCCCLLVRWLPTFNCTDDRR
jgi:ABC-type multidrug transport system fused ATPase/permease subunit